MLCLAVLGLELLAVLLLPPLLGLDPYSSDLAAGFWAGPSPAHPLGTDDAGRDLLARLLCGGRVSLLIALSAAAVSAGLGVPLGLLAGYRRGAWEFWIMRLADVFQSFPSIVLVLCLVVWWARRCSTWCWCWGCWAGRGWPGWCTATPSPSGTRSTSWPSGPWGAAGA